MLERLDRPPAVMIASYGQSALTLYIRVDSVASVLVLSVVVRGRRRTFMNSTTCSAGEMRGML